VGLEKHYERYQEEDFERFPEYQKAISFLTISDEAVLRFENQQKQEELEEVTKKNLQFEDMAKRIDELENSSGARWNAYFRESFNKQDDSKSQLMLAVFQMWFEMKSTEEEKRAIWKKLQDAKKEGRIMDISEFRDSEELSWNNFYSKIT